MLAYVIPLCFVLLSIAVVLNMLRFESQGTPTRARTGSPWRSTRSTSTVWP